MKFLTKYFHHSSVRALILVSLLAIVSLGFAFTKVAFASDPSASNVQRLVTIHDGDTEVTVVTRAGTVADALKAAEVQMSNRDIVEPAASEKLVAKSYQINVFRARPVVVVDGAKKVRVMTAEQSPQKVAALAGVPLYDEDKTALQRVDSVLLGGGAGVEMVISRATSFNFSLYGKHFVARTQTKTVGDLLKEKGVTLSAADGVSPASETPVAEGMSVRVWRNGKQTVTQEEVVTRPVEEIKSADKDSGTREVQTPGADGKRNVTYEIETQNGVEVSRKEIASVTTLEAQKQVVIVGTKVSLPTGSHEDWMAAAGISASDYGYVNFLVSRESGWRIDATNSSSGAYGLGQALPASKMASYGADYLTNPITQLKWMNAYVSRYGGWAGAYSFWQSHHWY